MKTSQAQVIDFQKAAARQARKYTALGGGLYKRADGSFWERPVVDGVRTIRKLKALTERAARLELGKRRIAQADSDADPRVANPYKRTSKLTIAEIADFYLESHCPKRDRSPRTEKQLAEEKRRVASIKEFFGRREWDAITQDDWTAYGNTRLKQVRAKFRTGTRDGARAVNLELATWGSMFRWAQRHPGRTGVKHNPLAGDRPLFQPTIKIRHCRETQPASADELHRIAARMFDEPRSEVLAWQMLIEAFTGRRTHEVLELRWDATAKEQAGYLEFKTARGRKNMHRLWFSQSQTHKGTYPWIEIQPHLRECLELLHDWRAARYPTSPWFFPSPDDPARHVDISSLTKALTRVCQELQIPHRTSHGLRSYYVNVLRSDRDSEGRQKIPDSEIAVRIGHKTGGRLIVDVYGEIGDQIHFMPSTVPVAWSKFLKGRAVQLDLGL